MTERAERYLARAEECRAIADTMENAGMRDAMLGVARDYVHMAGQADIADRHRAAFANHCQGYPH